MVGQLPTKRSGFLAGFALLVLAVTLAVAVLRTRSALQLTAVPPGVSVTSGCEEESFFAVWRVMHDQPVWLDLTQPPYASAYFNWLFYRSYGAVAKIAATGHGDPALVWSGRLFTLAGALVGAAALGAFAWRLTDQYPPVTRLSAVALGVFAFLGPLPGWWLVTVRPDIWATTAECLGLLVVLLRWRQAPMLTALIAAACFYASWAFKQNFVQGLGIALLFLAWNHQWKTAITLLALMVAGWGLTLVVLGPDYRTALAATASANRYDLKQGWENLLGAGIRCVPLIIPALGLALFRRAPATSALSRDSLQFALIGLPLSLAFTFAISCKLGAASNYYFTPMVFAALLAVVALTRIISVLPGSLALLAALALGGYVLTSGSLKLEAQSATASERWALWKDAPFPRYSHDQRFNLPWLNPGAPVFLIAFNYPTDRSSGRKFAHDGIGGLIREGYFRSLLLPDYVNDSHDGASLAGYQRGPTSAGFSLWLRREVTGVPAENR